MVVSQTDTSMLGTVYGLGQGHRGQGQGHRGQGQNMNILQESEIYMYYHVFGYNIGGIQYKE